jgi:hypothetical protein
MGVVMLLLPAPAEAGVFCFFFAKKKRFFPALSFLVS